MNFRDSSAGFLANHMARLFASALAEGLRPLGIAPAQFMVLLELWREDGLTQRDLVERLDVEQATMASTLNRMERDGLIERRAHATDRRAQLIHATDKARGLERTPKLLRAASMNVPSRGFPRRRGCSSPASCAR
jgi:DNA-binding MarR family transcriptional regulator